MLDQLVGQVKRLFSSKSNGGKLVYKLTDRLHNYKQVLLATSIVLLLGYSQFRDHFQCQGIDKIDKRVLTNFCWINGTTTLDLMPDHRSSSNSDYTHGKLVPHVGIQFSRDDGKYQLVSHNYMRSLWALLILMAVCSFMAQRKWATIFEHDILKALLKLPGYEKLKLVKKAEEACAYNTLIHLPISKTTRPIDGQMQMDKLLEGSKLFHSINSLTGDENEYNHQLDYYPNQLIYLLLAKRSGAYKLSDLKLRRKLIAHSACSLLLTSMQFVLPCLFIGDKYQLYGIDFLKAWLRSTLKQLMNPNSSVNSIDYELSSRIWPTSVQCEYKQFGIQGIDSVTVQCTVSINEICSKLFVVIWWFVAINILVELYTFLLELVCFFNFKALKWMFGQLYWPKAKQEASVVANFRYQHAVLLNKQIALDSQAEPSAEQGESKAVEVELEDQLHHEGLSEKDRKRLEAEGRSGLSLGSKKWYLWCSRDIGLFLADRGRRFSETKPGKLLAPKNARTCRDEEGFCEVKEDSNIYCLLYLLYMRLNGSETKIEQIIKMSSRALNRYIESLSKFEDLLASGSEVKGGSIESETGTVSQARYGDEDFKSAGSTIIDVE